MFSILNRTILPVLLAVICQGCFTGVESTPRISSSDVRKETKDEGSVFSVQEEKIASALVPPPPASWRVGDRFIVCDDKISHTFISTPQEKLPAPGDTISFSGFSTFRNILGENSTVANFISAADDTLSYRIDTPLDVVLQRNSLEIPFTIPQEMVSRAASGLKGMKTFINTSFRYGAEDGKRIEQKRFQPVEITDVRAGSVELPFKVYFKETVNGTPTEYFLWMTPGNSRNSTRNFPALFSLSNPREKYPKITDEVWEAIVSSRVIRDMTRQECRLAIGSPSEVIHGRSYSYVYERWIYQDGRNLIFEDGLLKSIR